MEFIYLTSDVIVEMSKAKYNYENDLKLSYAQKQILPIYFDILEKKIVPFISPNILNDICGGKKSILINAENKSNDHTFNRIKSLIDEINMYSYELTSPNVNEIKNVKNYLNKCNLNNNCINDRICFDIACTDLNKIDKLVTLKKDIEKVKKYNNINIVKIFSIDPKAKKFTKEQTLEDKLLNPFKYNKNKYNNHK